MCIKHVQHSYQTTNPLHINLIIDINIINKSLEYIVTIEFVSNALKCIDRVSNFNRQLMLYMYSKQSVQI